MAEILSNLFAKSKEPTDESDLVVIPDLVDRAPNLHDFMRFERWESNPVLPPRLGFEVRDGIFWAVLSDTERSRTGRFEVKGIVHGIEFIENLILSGELQKHLKAWPGKNGPKAKGKKRT
jgi:hypothetical protein